MTFLNVDFDSVVEPAPLPAGRYATQITNAEVKQTGERAKHPGRDQIVVSVVFTGDSAEEANAPAVTHFIALPHPDDEPRTASFKARMLKRFLLIYGVPFDSNGIDLEETCLAMIGCSADMEVSLSAPDDNGNVYNRLVLPRID